MKRSTLRRKSPLGRFTPLQGGSPLVRRTRLRPVSAQRRTQNRERRRMVEAKYGTGPVVCEVPWCTNLATDAHEPLSRARGGSITDPENVRAVCRPCHRVITDTEPGWAYDLGFLRHSWDERAECGLHSVRDACRVCRVCTSCGPCECELAAEWAREAS